MLLNFGRRWEMNKTIYKCLTCNTLLTLEIFDSSIEVDEDIVCPCKNDIMISLSDSSYAYGQLK